MKSPLIAIGHNAVERPIQLSPDQCRAHMHVIGASGSGKSKFLECLLRIFLRIRQGFCLIDPHGTLYNAVLAYCTHFVLKREIILLDLSQSGQIISFNPFQRARGADVSVLVDRRIKATMHAWNVVNTDQTPTLERTLRLIYTIMIERGVNLPQVQHLIDWQARDIRAPLIEQLESPLIRREWQELQQLTRREWREEILSAKNRLFRFLTSPALCRVMGVPGRTLDLQPIMDRGALVFVNLAPSDHLSEEQGRVFGSLFVNEFFETARRRKPTHPGHDPEPYYLFIDEFQNFVSLDMCDMLDQVRKFGLFLTLAHQRFGQLDEKITDAILANCRIKAVFGGLPVQSARLMAEELFIGELDPKRVKVAIYQTKFWPKYQRDKVYTRSTSTTTSSGTTTGNSHSSSYGSGESRTFQPGDWFFSFPEETSLSKSKGRETGDVSSHQASDSFGMSESESVADVPILMPVPFEELSNIQYYTPEEQLIELTAALKEQFQRHCFIKIHEQQTQPMLVPFVKSFYTTPKNRDWYVQRCLKQQQALPAAEVDRLIEQNDRALVQIGAGTTDTSTSAEVKNNGVHVREAKAPGTPPTPDAPPTILRRPSLTSKKKKINAGKGKKKKADVQPELPVLDITDNPLTQGE